MTPLPDINITIMVSKATYKSLISRANPWARIWSCRAWMRSDLLYISYNKWEGKKRWISSYFQASNGTQL